MRRDDARGDPDGERSGAGRGRPARLFWTAYASAWAVFALGYTLMIGLRSRRSLLEAASPALSFTVPAAVLGVGVVLLARRWEWPPGRPVAFTLLHAAAACAYSFLWGASFSLAFGVNRLLAGGEFATPGFDNTLIALHLLFGLVLYGAIAGGTYLARVGHRLRAERERTARAEALRTRAQFRALRARVDPHFLFNALHSVLSLIRRAPGRAERALEHLADLLRYALGGGEGRAEWVTLGREMEMVRTYLELEKIRLGDRLRVEEEISEEAASVTVPPLTVQPLVENAIQHGISESPGRGTIRVRAGVDGRGGDERLEVRVRDDGPGAEPDAVGSSGGEGLRLVRRRLDLMYGDDAELVLETSPGEGFAARIRVPVDDDLGVAAPGPGPGTGDAP